MAWVKIRVPRTSQPQDACGIDWGNPLTAGLAKVYTGKSLREATGYVFHGVGPSGLQVGGVNVDFPIGELPVTGITLFQLAVFSSINNVSSGNISTGTADGFGFKNNTTNLRLLNYAGAGNTVTTSSIALQTGVLTSACGTYDLTTQRLYQDGVQVGSTANTGAFNFGTTPSLSLGSNFAVSGFTAEGACPLLLYYTRALPAAEVKSLTDNPWQIFEPEELTIWVPDAVGVGGAAAVYSDAYAAYLIRAAAAQDLSASFAIRAATLASLDPAYNVRGSATADQAAAYNIRAAANLDLSPTYNVRGAAQIDLTPAYNLRGLIAKDAAAIYNVRGAVTADITPAYSIENAGTVASDLAAAYGVRGLVQSDASIAYELRGAVQNSLSPAYALRGAVAADLSGNYAVEAAVGVVQSDLTCSYAVDGVAAPCPSAADIAAAVRADLAAELLQLTKISKIHGVGVPLVVTPTTRTAGDLVQSITTVGDTTTVSAV